MTDNAKSAPKLTYSTPKLVDYGDMAMLTKGGAGSQPEVTAADLSDPNKLL